MVKFTINGKEAYSEQPVDTPLLWVVREELGLTGTKFGCGVAQCGACTVHVDGKPVRSCVTPVSRGRRKKVTTIEGLAPAGDHPLQKAWIARAGAAMRLLPVGADHAGGRAAREEQAADARTDRRATWTATSAAAALITESCAPSSAPRRRSSHDCIDDQDQPPRLHADGRRTHLLVFLCRTRQPTRSRKTPPSAPSSTPGSRIGADGTVTVMMPAAEMGQGVLTALPLMLAEELDADWAKVTTQYAPPNPKIYGNYHPALRRRHADGGERLHAGILDVDAHGRRAGAPRAPRQRRAAMERAALRSSPPSLAWCVHAKSARRISYGDVVKFATVPEQPPQISEADLKKPSQFRLIGRQDIPRVDVPSKVDGSAKYGIDVRLPGMLYASVLEAPMDGAKATKVNSDEAMKVPGVKKVLPLPFGVAVVGDTVQATRPARSALKVEWDAGGAKAAPFNSEKAMEEYARTGADPNAKAMAWFEERRRAPRRSPARRRRSRPTTGLSTATTRRWSR